jgi:hypothetical protein
MVLRPTFPLLVVLPLSLIGLLPSDLLAQPQAPAPQEQRDEPATKFERFILAKGMMRVRELYEIGTVAGRSGGSAKFWVARAYTPGRTDHVLALSIEVTEAGRLNRQRTGAMDADEVASLAAALPQMVRMVETLKQKQQTPNTEVDFRGGSLRVGFFVPDKSPLSNLPPGTVPDGALISAGEVAPVQAFFDVKQLDQIAALVSKAATKIKELQPSK